MRIVRRTVPGTWRQKKSKAKRGKVTMFGNASVFVGSVFMVCVRKSEVES